MKGLDKKFCEITIAEKLQLRSEKELYQFLSDLLKKQAVFLTPSGLKVSFEKYRMPSLKMMSIRWFGELSKMPYCEELPTIDDLYQWMESEQERKEAWMEEEGQTREDILAEHEAWVARCAYQLNLLDKIYAVCSSPKVTGTKRAYSDRMASPFYVKDGRLICHFAHQKEEQVVIPENVKVIGTRAFYYTGFLKYVVVHSGVKMIEEDAFYIDDVESSEQIFLELQSKDTLFGGEVSGGCKEAMEEFGCDFRPYLIAPKYSRAWEYAKLRKYQWAEDLKSAILLFLSHAESYEHRKRERKSVLEAQLYFSKAEEAARYGIRNLVDAHEIAARFFQIAVTIPDEIRDGTFREDEAVKLMKQYGED